MITEQCSPLTHKNKQKKYYNSSLQISKLGSIHAFSLNTGFRSKMLVLSACIQSVISKNEEVHVVLQLLKTCKIWCYRSLCREVSFNNTYPSLFCSQSQYQECVSQYTLHCTHTVGVICWVEGQNVPTVRLATGSKTTVCLLMMMWWCVVFNNLLSWKEKKGIWGKPKEIVGGVWE